MKLWHSIRWKWYGVRFGVANLVAFAPLIWHDDWIDFTYLLDLVAFKLKRDAAKFEKHGHVADSDKIAREMRECVELCRRIIADDYFVQAGYGDHDHWETLADYRQTQIVKHAKYMREQDLQRLTEIIRKRVLCWWD